MFSCKKMECQLCYFLTPNIRLRLVRTMLGLKERAMFRFLGVKQTTYWSWETRALNLREKHRKRLASAGISSKYLEYGDEPPFTRDRIKTKNYILESAIEEV